MKSDKIIKWSFITIVLCIVVIATGMFFVSDGQWEEASEKAAESAEKMRL